MTYEDSVPKGLWDDLATAEDGIGLSWEAFHEQAGYDFGPEVTRDGHGLRAVEGHFCAEGLWLSIKETSFGEGKDAIARAATLRPEELEEAF